jgi:type VI secretion system Hcp family effector
LVVEREVLFALQKVERGQGMNQKKKSGYSAYLIIADNPGESTSVGHEDTIALLDYSYCVERGAKSNPSGTGGLAEGTATHGTLVGYKFMDKSSLGIAQALYTGENIKEAQLDIARSTGDMANYLEMKMTNVMVTTYAILTDVEAVAISPDIDRPVERFELAYTTVEMEYTQQNPDGTAAGKLSASWDRSKNKTV